VPTNVTANSKCNETFRVNICISNKASTFFVFIRELIFLHNH